ALRPAPAYPRHCDNGTQSVPGRVFPHGAWARGEPGPWRPCNPGDVILTIFATLPPGAVFIIEEGHAPQPARTCSPKVAWFPLNLFRGSPADGTCSHGPTLAIARQAGPRDDCPRPGRPLEPDDRCRCQEERPGPGPAAGPGQGDA